MNRSEFGSLTFPTVDGLAFAAARGRLSERLETQTFVATELGPTIELLQLSREGLLPPFTKWHAVSKDGLLDLCSAICGGRRKWLSSDRQLGFFRLGGDFASGSSDWTGFLLNAQRAAITAGFPTGTGRQFAAALGELASNVHEHSEDPSTGVVTFRAVVGGFEFVVCDCGIGVLQSLRSCSSYMHLRDHGDALELALTEGCSRHGPGSGHGFGFRPIFVGLANLNGSLRFRSGDHALTIDGRDLSTMPWRKASKPPMYGFLASVSCTTRRSGNLRSNYDS